MMENWQGAGFGLYIHWPFCAAKCPYCDFNSHVTDRVDVQRWQAAFLRDLDHWAERTGPRRLSSIFFGGGTPSMMPPDLVGAIIERAGEHWMFANDIEITLEANPTSADADRFAGFVDGGVNRFSVGLQALNDHDLKRLGRLHSVKEGRAAFEMARGLVDRVSCDLIYARQDQTVEEWRIELAEALEFVGDHLSLYQLTIEDGTAFGRRHAIGRLRGLPDEDLSIDLWNATQELCDSAGFVRYETSNHSRPGAESRHNLIYWRGGDWIGIGPGAHGRLSSTMERLATEAEPMPQAWLSLVETAGSGTALETVLPLREILDEQLLMGLRLREGIDLLRYREGGGRLNSEGLREMISLELAVLHDGRLRTTEKGALLLNSVLLSLSPPGS